MEEKYYRYFLHTYLNYSKNSKNIYFGAELANDLDTLIKLSKDTIFTETMISSINSNVFISEKFINKVLLKQPDVYFAYLPSKYKNDISIMGKAIIYDNENIKYIDIKDLKKVVIKHPELINNKIIKDKLLLE